MLLARTRRATAGPLVPGRLGLVVGEDPDFEAPLRVRVRACMCHMHTHTRVRACVCDTRVCLVTGDTEPMHRRRRPLPRRPVPLYRLYTACRTPTARNT